MGTVPKGYQITPRADAVKARHIRILLQAGMVVCPKPRIHNRTARHTIEAKTAFRTSSGNSRSCNRPSMVDIVVLRTREPLVEDRHQPRCGRTCRMGTLIPGETAAALAEAGPPSTSTGPLWGSREPLRTTGTPLGPENRLWELDRPLRGS